jgi:hypothetical protein
MAGAPMPGLNPTLTALNPIPKAAIQAEEEACWHAHQTATTTAPKQGRVA